MSVELPPPDTDAPGRIGLWANRLVWSFELWRYGVFMPGRTAKEMEGVIPPTEERSPRLVAILKTTSPVGMASEFRTPDQRREEFVDAVRRPGLIRPELEGSDPLFGKPVGDAARRTLAVFASLCLGVGVFGPGVGWPWLPDDFPKLNTVLVAFWVLALAGAGFFGKSTVVRENLRCAENRLLEDREDLRDWLALWGKAERLWPLEDRDRTVVCRARAALEDAEHAAVRLARSLAVRELIECDAPWLIFDLAFVSLVVSGAGWGSVPEKPWPMLLALGLTVLLWGGWSIQGRARLQTGSSQD